jgi:hypothetical protein
MIHSLQMFVRETLYFSRSHYLPTELSVLLISLANPATWSAFEVKRAGLELGSSKFGEEQNTILITLEVTSEVQALR